MATLPTQIRIDEEVKKQATELFSKLGLDISSAVNIFLRQSILQGGLPFEVKMPRYRPEVIEAMREARTISKDTTVKGYTDLEVMSKELDN